MAILTGIGQLITCIENPIILLQHILGSSTQQLVLLVHDVGAQIVTQAQILGHLIVTQEEERDIVLEVVFLRTAHIIIGNDLAPVSARNAHSRVTQTQVCGLDACAIIIESIFIPRLTNLSITYYTIFRQSKQYLKQKLHIRF